MTKTTKYTNEQRQRIAEILLVAVKALREKRIRNYGDLALALHPLKNLATDGGVSFDESTEYFADAVDNGLPGCSNQDTEAIAEFMEEHLPHYSTPATHCAGGRYCDRDRMAIVDALLVAAVAMPLVENYYQAVIAINPAIQRAVAKETDRKRAMREFFAALWFGGCFNEDWYYSPRRSSFLRHLGKTWRSGGLID
jgi:hypothetical protein